MVFHHSRSYLMHQLDQLEFSIFFPDQKFPNSTTAEIVPKQAFYVWTDGLPRTIYVPGTKAIWYIVCTNPSSLSFGKPVFWPAVFDWIAPELVFVSASQCK